MAKEQAAKSEMANQLTPQEAKALLIFLNRVDLKGQESEVHAALKHKLTLIMQTPAEVKDKDLGAMEGMKGEHRE